MYKRQLLTVSTAGLPVALSKLVSESYALGRTRQAHRTFRVSLSIFLVLGVASFALMWWGRDLSLIHISPPSDQRRAEGRPPRPLTL